MVKKIEMVPSFSGVAKHVSRVQKVIAKIKQKKIDKAEKAKNKKDGISTTESRMRTSAVE